MSSINRFSFHCGPSGNHNGLGDFIRRCAEAKVPFALMSTDHYGHLREAISACDLNGLTDFTFAYRITRREHYDFDVPGQNYEQPVNVAASEYWSQLLAVLPPEFDKRCWLVILNEPDKNKLEYVAEFCQLIAHKSVASGYRCAFMGLNSGEPEVVGVNQWTQPSMSNLLRLCAAHPNQLGIALHEYSYSPDIQRDYGWLVGRWNKLSDSCPQIGIRFEDVSILITEWGWGRDHLTYPGKLFALEAITQIERMTRQKNIRMQAIWCLNGGWGNLDNEVAQLIPHLTQMVSSATEVIPYNGGESPPSPCGGCRGKPRIQYKRHCILIPQHYGVDWSVSALRATYASRTSVIYSADDCGIGDLDDRTVTVVNAIEYEQNKTAPTGSETDPSLFYIYQWYGEHYPGVKVKFVSAVSPDDLYLKLSGHPVPPQPPPVPPGGGNCWFGIHASATGNVSSAEAAMIKSVHPEVIKILSSTTPESMEMLLRDNSFVHNWVVRAYLSFGGRNISPDQFVNDTVSDVKRTLNFLQGKNVVVELHNEPNLKSEGWTFSWQNGADFSVWIKKVLSLYKAHLPNTKFLFPAMSPGQAIPGERYDAWAFMREAQSSIEQFPDMAVHSYWSDIFPMKSHADSGVMLVDSFIARYPGKRLWITESSNNIGQNWVQKGNEYIEFWREMKRRPSVVALCYFVASAAQGDFINETWMGTPIPSIVAGR